MIMTSPAINDHIKFWLLQRAARPELEPQHDFLAKVNQLISAQQHLNHALPGVVPLAHSESRIEGVAQRAIYTKNILLDKIAGENPVVLNDSSYFSSATIGSGSSGRGSSSHSSPVTSGSRGGKSSASPIDDFHSDGGASSDVDAQLHQKEREQKPAPQREKQPRLHKNNGHPGAAVSPLTSAPKTLSFTVNKLLATDNRTEYHGVPCQSLGTMPMAAAHTAYSTSAYPLYPVPSYHNVYADLPPPTATLPPFSLAPPHFVGAPPPSNNNNNNNSSTNECHVRLPFFNFTNGQSAFSPIVGQSFDSRIALQGQNGSNESSPAGGGGGGGDDDAARRIDGLSISGHCHAAVVQSALSSCHTLPAPESTQNGISPKRHATAIERNMADIYRQTFDQPLRISIGSTTYQRDDSSRSTFDPSPSVSAGAGNVQRDAGGSSYDDSLSPMSSSEHSRSNSPLSVQQLSLNADAKCAVCDDKASGYHYGVVSCEGCKGFFRRTVQRDIKYHCHKESKCAITRITRNRCQFCRFKKCLDSGMAKESVRQDRNRKRKQKDDDEESQAIQNWQQMIRTIVNAYRQLELQINKDSEKIAEACLVQNFDQTIAEMFMKFAEQIPGFECLSPKNREILWRSGSVEITALRCAFAEASKKGQVTSEPMNHDLDDKDLLRTKMASFRTSVSKLARSFKQLEVSHEEIALLSAICLMSNGVPSVKVYERKGLIYSVSSTFGVHVEPCTI